MTADQHDPQHDPQDRQDHDDVQDSGEVDQDAGPASQPTGAAAEGVEEGEDQDSGPASEPSPDAVADSAGE